MADISELEGRITTALDRIAQGVATIQAIPQGNPEAEAELEQEKARTAELTDTQSQHKARIERLESRVLRLTDRLEDAETENARLNGVISALRDHAEELTQANKEHQDAGPAISQAAQAELEDLRAARAADLVQMEEILAELAPALKEA